MIRVLFVIPDLRWGGAERQVIELANGLDRARFEVFLLTFGDDQGQLPLLDRDRTIVIESRRGHRTDLAPARDIALAIDEHRIDVVYCTLQIAVFFGWLGARLARRPVRLVAGVHTTINRSARNELFDRLLYRFVMGRFDRLVFVCEAQARHWRTKFPELGRIGTVVHNGVAPARFAPDAFQDMGRALRRSHGIPADAPVIACIAALRPEKGHLFLVESLSMMVSPAHLLLAGDGAMRDAIQAAVRESDLGHRVHFLGAVADVRPVLAAADVSVLASTAVETFSMAMLESMAMEVPVIATELGGVREAIEPGETGDVVPPAQPRALADALDRMLGSGRVAQMGAAARRSVSAKFSLAAMLAGTERVIGDTAGHVEP